MDKQYYGHANISISQQQGGGSKRVYFVHGSEWPIFRAQIWFFFGNRVWGRREWCKFYLFFSDHFAGLGVSVGFLLFQIELEYQLCRSGNITTDSSGIFYNRVLRSLVFWTDWAGLSGEGGRHRGRLHN